MSTQALRTDEPAATGQQAANGREAADVSPAEVGQVMGQLMADLAATSGMLLTLVGVRTGLWESLAAGPASPAELAVRSSGHRPLHPAGGGSGGDGW